LLIEKPVEQVYEALTTQKGLQAGGRPVWDKTFKA
jgi:hypothetical protein